MKRGETANVVDDLCTINMLVTLFVQFFVHSDFARGFLELNSESNQDMELWRRLPFKRKDVSRLAGMGTCCRWREY